MTDHELIMVAAKATGMTLIPRDDGTYEVANLSFYTRRWNPLTCNDDAFELMVDHELLVFYHDNQVIIDWIGAIGFVEEPFGTDKHAATRRAIVQALVEKARSCKRPGCNLTPPCPDCGLALHDVPADE